MTVSIARIRSRRSEVIKSRISLIEATMSCKIKATIRPSLKGGFPLFTVWSDQSDQSCLVCLCASSPYPFRVQGVSSTSPLATASATGSDHRFEDQFGAPDQSGAPDKGMVARWLVRADVREINGASSRGALRSLLNGSRQISMAGVPAPLETLRLAASPRLTSGSL